MIMSPLFTFCQKVRWFKQLLAQSRLPKREQVSIWSRWFFASAPYQSSRAEARRTLPIGGYNQHM